MLCTIHLKGELHGWRWTRNLFTCSPEMLTLVSTRTPPH